MQTASFQKQIILAFRRRPELTDGVHLVEGYFDLKVNTAKGRNHFEDNTFEEVIKAFSALAQDVPDAELFMMRLEQKPKPIAMHLDEQQATMLRENVEAFLRTISPPPQRVVIRKTDNIAVSATSAVFKAGHEALADAFGDEIYIRTRKWWKDERSSTPVWRGEIESVFDGRWKECHTIVGINEDGKTISCPGDIYDCAISLATTFKKVNDNWAKVNVVQLLAIGEKREQKRYFLPRAWNTSGPWITHGDLKKKYLEFLKEAAQAELQ